MARSLGDRDVEVDALGTIGATRVCLGDPGGVQDLERCIALCEADGSSRVISWQNNLAFSLALLGDLRRCFSVREAGWEAAEHFGSARGLRWLELERAAECYWTGRWDQAVRIADLVAPTARRRAPSTTWSACAGSGGAASGWPGASWPAPARTRPGPWPWPGSRATA
jgi:hypothetical protein